jgi:HEAT repeat protein
MLEGLDRIDWSKLHHAYGEATGVPGLIRDLLSNDQRVREEAMDELSGSLWHQGTVYEASSYAIPFLQELLKAADTPNKPSIVVLLCGMATGNSAYEGILGNQKVIKGMTYEELWRGILAKQGKVLEDEVRKGSEYVERARLAVGMELPLLYPYLLEGNPYVRAMAAHAVAHFGDSAHETVPLLESALAAERDEAVKAAMTKAIANLKTTK